MVDSTAPQHDQLDCLLLKDLHFGIILFNHLKVDL
jgi:hypothetical protein